MDVDNSNDEFKLPDICIKKYHRNTSKENELMNAVANGNIKELYNLLWNENVSPKVTKDFYGSDLLTIATQNDRTDLVKLLMKMNLDPKHKNNYGVTPIHWAANNGNDYMIKELCNHGLTVKDLEKQDQFGSTPLHFAVLKNNENIVQLLISSGINPMLFNNDGMKASDVTTDISIKKFLKDEENRYMAEHFKKKSKKKSKKKGGKGKSSRSAPSTPNKKSSMSKQPSMVRSVSVPEPKKSKSTTTPTLSKKRSISRVLPPAPPSFKPIVANKPEREVQVLNPTSYAMRNFNQEVITLNPPNSARGSKKNSPKGSLEKMKS